MTRKAILALIGVLAVALATPAQAKPHKAPRHATQEATHCVYGNTAVIVCSGPEYRATEPRRVTDANGNGAGVTGGRPAGCPYQFCGCEASLYVFGEIRKELNRAWAWAEKFPRASAASGMAAVRKHHVMILVRHVDGDDWLVHDGNSGGHKTREHVRSIAGYVIVDPRSRLALQ